MSFWRYPAVLLLTLHIATVAHGQSAEEKPRAYATVGIRLVGGCSTAGLGYLQEQESERYPYEQVEPYFLPGAAQQGAYPSVYPGIDFVCYGDNQMLEYIFVLHEGADPDLIELLFDGIQGASFATADSAVYEFDGGELYASSPVAFIVTNATLQLTQEMVQVPVELIQWSARSLRINADQVFEDELRLNNQHKFNVVPGGGQPGGPSYRFYMSKFETTHDQFLRFLNNAQAHTNKLHTYTNDVPAHTNDAPAHASDPKGANMYFDKIGNVWMNPEMRVGRDELFTITDSHLIYDPNAPVGFRYDHQRTSNGEAAFAKHPITGTSWFGSVKYCNWLTLISGRSEAELCYHEGTNVTDWAPITATNWIAKGEFTATERQQWLAYKGFRLPMVNMPGPVIGTNSYNEFYKAAAWQDSTNRLYGFGRDFYESYTDEGQLHASSMFFGNSLPVGYFDGTNRVAGFPTILSSNYYGFFDLTGNACEWANDFARTNNPGTRLLCGGSWVDGEPDPVNIGKIVTPSTTANSGGFRPVSSFLPPRVVIIHLLFSFYMETSGTLPKEIGYYPEEPRTPEEKPKKPVPPEEKEPPEEPEKPPTPWGLKYKVRPTTTTTTTSSTTTTTVQQHPSEL